MRKFGKLNLLKMNEPKFEELGEIPWEPHSPGYFVRKDILNEKKMSQGELAKRLGVSRRSINELVMNRRGISTEMAVRLSKFTRQSPEFWLKLQMRYDLWEIGQTNLQISIEPI